MRTPRYALIGLVASALCMPAASTTPGSSPDGTPRGRIIGAQTSEYPSWFAESFLDLAEDAADAGARGKHVILMFDSEGCPYCYKMIEDNFRHAAPADPVRRHFDVIGLKVRGQREVQFSADVRFTETELARYLNIRFTPTLLFLDADNRTVVRLNGYRSPGVFRQVLAFVHTGAYRDMDLVSYLAERKREPVYRLRAHPDFSPIRDLTRTGGLPLMVIFEDAGCEACDALHEDILGLDETRGLLGQMTVVRLDARSSEPIVDPAGNATTPARWVRELDLDYRPGVVMFDGAREVLRLDALRWTFHFQVALRYVAERRYAEYPRFNDYSREYREALLERGVDIRVRD